MTDPTQTADVCLFGGAFDPPHRSHERLIRAALAQLPITRVIVLPTGIHPLKQGAQAKQAAPKHGGARQAAPEHGAAPRASPPANQAASQPASQPATPATVRLELCRLAFAGIDGVEINDWDARRTEPCYTVDTLAHFREYVTGGRRPYWLVGSDNLTLLPSWVRHHEVLRLAVLVTFPRAGYPVDAATLAKLDLTDAERREILAHVLEGESDAVSATELRRRLRSGEDTSDLLHPPVARRIAELGLYGSRAQGA